MAEIRPAGPVAVLAPTAAAHPVRNDDTRLAAPAAHAAAGDPHPQYTTAAELGAALAGYQPNDSDLTTIAGLTPTDGQLVRRIAGAWAASTLTASDVGLGAVDNTSDAAKPISTATAAALAGKLDTTQKGAVSGLATLDATGKQPLSEQPRLTNPVRTGTVAAASFTIDAAGAGNLLDLTVTVATAALSAAPANPSNRQILRVALLAQVATAISIPTAVRLSTGIASRTWNVPIGQVLLLALEYSGLVGAWVCTAATISAT